MNQVALALACFALSGAAMVHAAEFSVTKDSVLRLASIDEARVALATEDDFIRALSEFDRASRMKSAEPPSKEEFVKFIAGESQAWTEAEQSKMGDVAKLVQAKLDGFRVPLPARILVVKTTGREEANAAYCRGTNIIVLPRRFVNAPARALESALIHELFHVLSRNSPRLREEIYSMIGFKPCGEIVLPEPLRPRAITNPDAPRLDFRMELQRGGRRISVVPVLFATPERWSKEKGGEFFAYFTWRLMAVERNDGKWAPLIEAEMPVLLVEKDVEGFREQIGEKAGDVLQAEEIAAENFVRMIETRDGEAGRVPKAMRALFKP